MKAKSRLSLALASLALASPLSGCVNEYTLNFQGDVVKVSESIDLRNIIVIDQYAEEKVIIQDGNGKVAAIKDGDYDSLNYLNIPSGSHFDKFRDRDTIDKLTSYVDTKIKELNSPKAEAQ